MIMIIKSDWHIHSEASYDSSLPLSEIVENAKKFGFEKIGITDHFNYNDEKFYADVKKSAKIVTAAQSENKNLILGVELTPIAKPEFDYIKSHGNSDGYIAPHSDTPYGIELAATKDELISMGVRYAIGASHWRVDVPGGKEISYDFDTALPEWYRQQMWLACDERVTVLGHPWYNGQGIWYDDFSRIPHSMNLDIAAALKENGKYAECNSQFFTSRYSTEKFKNQYAEFMRELFEMGIKITYGSDSHNAYTDSHSITEKYLEAAGFKAGDICEIAEEDFWF